MERENSTRERYNAEKEAFVSFLNDGKKDAITANLITDTVIIAGIVVSIYTNNFNVIKSTCACLTMVGINSMNYCLYLNKRDKMHNKLYNTFKDVKKENDEETHFDNSGYISKIKKLGSKK